MFVLIQQYEEEGALGQTPSPINKLLAPTGQSYRVGGWGGDKGKRQGVPYREGLQTGELL